MIMEKLDPRRCTDLIVRFGLDPSLFINRDGTFKPLFALFLFMYVASGVLYAINAYQCKEIAKHV